MMTIQTVCRFCDHECPVTVELDEANQPVRITHDRIREGFFCPGGVNALELMHNPKRVRTPLIAQTGADGKKSFRQASWEEALALTAEKLHAAFQQYGQESVVAIGGFNKPIHRAAYQRFCNVAGIINRVVTGNMCHMVQSVSAVHTFGTPLKPNLSKETKTIVLWGLNPANTMRWDSRALLNTVENGADLILVDPIPGIYAAKAKTWLPITPGTDLALIFGMIHIILEKGWYDQSFVEKHTVGLEELREPVAAYTLERTAELCGIEADRIVEAAQMIAKNGPVAFMYGNALHHNHDSYQKCRGMAILIALTGNVDVPGSMLSPGGMSPRNRTYGTSLHNTEAFPSQWRERGLTYDKYPLKEYNGVSGQEAVRAMQAGKIRAGYVHAADPVLQWADSKATARALGSLDFLAVSDFLLTPTAMQADVVFPAATYLEYESVIIDENENLRYSPRLSSQYDVLPDFEILRRLTVSMGKEDGFWTDAEAYWDAILEPYGYTLQDLREKGYVETPYQPEPMRVRNYRETGFPTSDGKIHLVLSEREGWVAPIPSYEPMQQAVDAAYPLHCTTYKPGAFFGGAGQQTKRQISMQPVPVAYIGTDVAERYGLSDGDQIRVISRTGCCIQAAKVAEGMARNTVALSNARWLPDEDGWEEQLAACANNLSSMDLDTGKEIPAFSCRGIACRIEKL